MNFNILIITYLSAATTHPMMTSQNHFKCFVASKFCFYFLTTPQYAAIKTTDAADVACKQTGGFLLELWNETVRDDFEKFIKELIANGSINITKVFINLRRISSLNRWMWVVNDKLRPLTWNISSNDNNSCGFVKLEGGDEVVYGSASCNEKKGFICKSDTNNCTTDPPCFYSFYGSSFSNVPCSLVTLNDAKDDEKHFEKKIVNSIKNKIGEFWIGLTRYYWCWRSTGAVVDFKGWSPWRWEPKVYVKDQCLLVLNDFNVSDFVAGVPWGVVCMTGALHYNLSLNVLSSSSSTSSSTSTSLSLSSSSSLPPSLSITSKEPIYQTSLSKNLNTDDGSSSSPTSIVLGTCLGVLTVILVVVATIKLMRRHSKLKEREANQEFQFTTSNNTNNDTSKHDALNNNARIIFDARQPDIIRDGTTSFSTKILRSITSGDQIRPVTPTSIDLVTSIEDYDGRDFRSSHSHT